MTRINEKDLLAFIMLKTAKATEPYPNKRNFKKFGFETGTDASDSSYFNVFRRIVDTLDTVRNYNLEEKARMLFMTSTSVEEDMLEEMRKIARIRVNDDYQIVSYRSKEGKMAFQGHPIKLKRRKNGGRKERKQHHPVDENLEESDGEEVCGAVLAGKEDPEGNQAVKAVKNHEEVLGAVGSDEEDSEDAEVPASEGDQAVEVAEDSENSLAEDMLQEDEQMEDSEDLEEPEPLGDSEIQKILEPLEEPLDEPLKDSEIQKILEDSIDENPEDDRQVDKEDSEGKEEIPDKIYGDLDENVAQPGDLELDELDEDVLLNEEFENMEDMETLDERALLDFDGEDFAERDFGEGPVPEDMEIDEIPEASTPSTFFDFSFDDSTVNNLLLENGDLGSLDNAVPKNMEPENLEILEIFDDVREEVNEGDFQEQPNEGDIEDFEEPIPEDEDLLNESLSESLKDYMENLTDEELLEADEINDQDEMDSDIPLDELRSFGSLAEETMDDSEKDDQLEHQVVSETQDAPRRNLKRKLESRENEPIAKKRIPGGEHESWSKFHSYVNNFGNGNETEKAILANEAFLKSIGQEFPFSGRSMMANKVQVAVLQKEDRAPGVQVSFIRLNRFHVAWVKAQKLREIENCAPEAVNERNFLGAEEFEAIPPPNEQNAPEADVNAPRALEPAASRDSLGASEASPEAACPDSEDPESEDVKPAVSRVTPKPVRQDSGFEESAIKTELLDQGYPGEAQNVQETEQNENCAEIAPEAVLGASEAQSERFSRFEIPLPLAETSPRVISTPPRPAVKTEILDQGFPGEAVVDASTPSATVIPPEQSEMIPPSDDTESTQDVKPVIPRVIPTPRAAKPELLDLVDASAPADVKPTVSRIIPKSERLDSEYEESVVRDQGYPDEDLLRVKPEHLFDAGYQEEEPCEPISPKLLTNRFFVNLEAFFNGFQSNEFTGLLQKVRQAKEKGETRGFRFTSDQLSIVIDICLTSMVKKSMNDEITRQSTLIPFMNEFLDGFLGEMMAIGCPKMTMAVTEHVNCEKKRISKEQRVRYGIINAHFSKMIDNLIN